MDIPEITEVQRMRLEPGDKLIVRIEARVDMATADVIKKHIRGVLGLAEDFPVLVLDRGANVEVVSSLCP